MGLLYFQHKSVNSKFVFKGGETPGGAGKQEKPKGPYQPEPSYWPLSPAEHAGKMVAGWDWVKRGDEANDPLKVSKLTAKLAEAATTAAEKQAQAEAFTENTVPKLKAAQEWAKHGDKGAPPPPGSSYAEEWVSEGSNAVASAEPSPAEDVSGKVPKQKKHPTKKADKKTPLPGHDATAMK